MKKTILALLALVVLAAPAVAGNKPRVPVAPQSPATMIITAQWDQMQDGETWQEVRLYDLSTTPETLIATAPCAAGPPILCPTTVSFTIARRRYQITARSFNGWESDNSNVVIVPGPPKPPVGLRR